MTRGAWAVVAIILAMVILVISMLPPRGTPGPQIADLGEVRALLLHALGYALLAASALLAQANPRPGWTAAAVIGYGVALEIAQGIGGLRSAQVSDAVANAGGVLIGVALALLVLRRA
ncbi:MAG: hypothetical protein ACR2KE_08990 [Candidatus Nanopelagicales bacterium]